MENARIGIFEDNDGMRELYRLTLEIEGHTIIHEAATVTAARDYLNILRESFRGDCLPDVFIVDGNLDGGESRVVSTEDGNKITARLKDMGITAIIGASGFGDIKGADINVRKEKDALPQIISYIADLPERQM